MPQELRGNKKEELCEGWWKKASPRFEEEFYEGQASLVAQTIKNLSAM